MGTKSWCPWGEFGKFLWALSLWISPGIPGWLAKNRWSSRGGADSSAYTWKNRLCLLDKIDCLHMEKGLNMWNSMGQSGGHSAQSRQEHKHPEETTVLITVSVNICTEPFCTSMSHRGGFGRVSIQATSNFICQLKWFSGTATSRRRKMWHAGNDTWVSTLLWAGAEGAEIFQLCLLPKQLPQEKLPGQV